MPLLVEARESAQPAPISKLKAGYVSLALRIQEAAGEMLGLKLIYMDAGSGAKRPIAETMIKEVAAAIEIPLIVGGGIKDPEKAYRNARAGADLIVVGNAIEDNPALVKEMAAAIQAVKDKYPKA